MRLPTMLPLAVATMTLLLWRSGMHHIMSPGRQLALAPLSACTGRHHSSSGSIPYQRSATPSTEVFTLTETAARRLEQQLWILQVQLQLSTWHSNNLAVFGFRWRHC